MADPDLIRLFIGPLEELRLRYMITGGVASVIYGDPRFTRDVDIVLDLQPEDARRFATAFPGEEFYVPPLEVLEEEIARLQGGHFNVIHADTTLRADVYLIGTDPLHAWAFPRRRRISVEQAAIWVAPLEYVLVRKLEYFRASGSDRHLRDVAMMLQVSGDAVEWKELEAWVGELGLEEALEEARSFN